MSINTLAVQAADKAGAATTTTGTRDVAAARNDARVAQDETLAALTKYIPTESITLYVATVSAQKAITSFVPWLTPTVAYNVFVVVTPVLMLVLFLRKFAVAGQDWKVHPMKWPWWRLVASTIAFAVWALAVPGNPIINADSETGGVVAAFAAMLVSTLLNLFAPFFETP